MNITTHILISDVISACVAAHYAAVGMDYTTAGGECHLDAVPVPLGANPAFRTTAAVRFYKVAPQLDPDAPTDVRGHGGPSTVGLPRLNYPFTHQQLRELI